MKLVRHSCQKTPFLAFNTHPIENLNLSHLPPPSLPFNIDCSSFQYNFVLLATLVEGGGGPQCVRDEVNNYYYTTQAVRGAITEINQSKCSIAGPIFSKYWTGRCPE